MEIKKYFSHFVSLVLLGLAGFYKEPAMIYACVCSVLGILAKESLDLYLQSKVPVQQPGIPEEVRKTLHDINARVATLEYGVRQRGF